MGASFAVVGLLHLIGITLLAFGVFREGIGAAIIGVALIAYLRGLVHSFDFDHVSMIDNSTRKFVTEGHRPASVGLAFSAGHSTVVILTSAFVVGGASWIRHALEADSQTATVLGIVGVSVSGSYLLLVALANMAGFLQALRLRRQLNQNPHLAIDTDALRPKGPAARVLTAPLARITAPRHVYLLGMLFSLGFDTSSQIGLLVLTTGAALAGVPPIALLGLPFLFAAAMTLGDTANGLMMLRMYTTAQREPRRLITYNLLITGIGIVSGLLVAVLAAAALLDSAGLASVGLASVGRAPVIAALTSADTEHAGFMLAALMAAIGAVTWVIWRRSSPSRVRVPPAPR